MDGEAELVPNLTEVKVSRIDRTAEFAPRGTSSSHYFVGDGIKLRPTTCALASAGSRPSKLGARACGAWRGSINAPDALSAASRLASLLGGSVLLDGCGVLASSDLPVASLRFLKKAPGEDEDVSSQAEDLLGGTATAMRLAGQLGQILSHRGDLWLRACDAEFDALLVLTPTDRSRVAGRPTFDVAMASPMGLLRQTWEEVALIELPRLMRLTIDGCVDRRAAALAKDTFLVDEEEEFLRIQCWHRRPGVEAESGEISRAPQDTISLEQLLWYTTVSCLADTPPCAEAAVPSLRIELADEGRASREEILGESAPVAGDVPSEDAPRLASVEFLRQYLSQEAIAEEMLPRLLPTGRSVRIFSAQLASSSSLPQAAPGRGKGPKTLDDLFGDDVDFNSFMPSRATDEDPLANYELTSVFLLNESTGFLMAFHCVQGIDPLTTS